MTARGTRRHRPTPYNWIAACHCPDALRIPRLPCVRRHTVGAVSKGDPVLIDGHALHIAHRLSQLRLMGARGGEGAALIQPCQSRRG
jgi:hypothetical protein